MFLIYAPPDKFGNLPPKTPLLSEEVMFTNNLAYCPKFFWKKYHIMQGCRDLTPGWMIRMRRNRVLNGILIIATGGIGDSLWCMPFCKAVREKYPRSTILVVCNDRAMPAWQGVPFANLCVKDEFWNMQGLVRNADEVFDFAGIATNKQLGMGLDPVEAIFKSGDLPIPKNKKDCRPQLVVGLDEGKRAEALLRREGIEVKQDKIISIALESSTSNRNWVFEYVKDLTRQLITDGFKVIWLGESTDYETRMLDDATNAIGAVNLVHRTSLRETIAILALSDVFVGPASGLMVIATSLEIPTVGLFGAFNPKSRSKYYDKFIGLWHKIDCAPCNDHWTECRKGYPSPCMKVISPGEVHEAVMTLHRKYPRPIIGKLPLE